MKIWSLQFKEQTLIRYEVDLIKSGNGSVDRQPIAIPKASIERIDVKRRIIFLKVLPYAISKDYGQIQVFFTAANVTTEKIMLWLPSTLPLGYEILWKSERYVVDQMLKQIFAR